MLESLPKEILNILTKIEAVGFEAYLVGGSVRDFIIGKESYDFDITTSATPDEIKEIFADCTIIETGIAHGTVTLIINEVKTEITTFRVDGKYSDSRHPEAVSFTKTLASDLARRDFTINTICYSPSVGFIDIFDGIGDIKKRKIKTVGNPDKRFSEDALRILRALRFSSTLGFEIENETKKSIFKQKNLLKNISSERIASEFSKILLSPFANIIFSEFYEVFSVILPEIFSHTEKRVYEEFVFPMSMLALSKANESYVCKISTILYGIVAMHHIQSSSDFFSFFSLGSDEFSASLPLLNTIIFKLKVKKSVKDEILEILRLALSQKTYNRIEVKKLLRFSNAENLSSSLRLSKNILTCKLSLLNNSFEKQETVEMIKSEIAVIEKELVAINNILENNECFTLKNLNISGNDLILIGIKDGKAIGEILDKLLSLVIEDKVKNSTHELYCTALKLYEKECDLSTC